MKHQDINRSFVTNITTLHTTYIYNIDYYYNDQRNSLFVKIGYDANLFYFNDSTFIDIMNNFPRQTANFIHNCYNLRQNI